jgi:polysaccharide biosynthesis/export protein
VAKTVWQFRRREKIRNIRSSLICLLYAAALTSCASATANRRSLALSSQVSSRPCAEQRTDVLDPSSYRIQSGDELQISFYLNPEFDEPSVIVRPDGKIALRFIGDIRAAGQTPLGLALALDEAYSSELRRPGATVIVKNSPSRVVYVAGQVTKPGEVPLVPHMTVMDAIAASGGLTDEAGIKKVIVARKDGCGNLDERIIDLDSLLKGKDKAEDVALAPADLVVVPRSTIANLDLVVKQYIKDMLPVQPYISTIP